MAQTSRPAETADPVAQALCPASALPTAARDIRTRARKTAAGADLPRFLWA